MSSIEEILKGIQSSRPMPTKVLYEGDLQGNYDQYFRPTPFHNQDNVPKAPKNLFCEYGATAEVDKRPFMTPQPQVPRNPELEGLNEYFNKQRVLAYARGVSAQTVGETIAKQAENVANSYVKDEIDRRAGIRKATLMSAGVSEADAKAQVAQEGLAGINRKTIDMRDQQITDAVNQYYNINNLPPPVTQPGANPARATVPTTAEDAIPVDAADREAEGEMSYADMAAQRAQELEEMDIRMKKNLDEVPATDATGGAGYAAPGRDDAPVAGEGDVVPMSPMSMSKDDAIDYIVRNNIQNALTADMRTGKMKARETMRRQMTVEALRAIAEDHLATRGGSGGASSNPANPSSFNASSE
jgi:hypothetical protein